jgi:hypothetical protein
VEDLLGVCGGEARDDYVAAAVCFVFFVCHGLISFFFDRGQCKQSILTLSFDCEVGERTRKRETIVEKSAALTYSKIKIWPKKSISP